MMTGRSSAAALALALLACGREPKVGTTAGGMAAAPGGPSDPRAAIFVSKGCAQCHSISALGLTSPAAVGPDLTLASGDVQNRFGVTLEEFLHNPTGTMQVVLSSSIQLTPVERDSIIRVLNGLRVTP